MATFLGFGDQQSGSATQRRKNAYRKDLELQMKEKEAARIRERFQDMSVNASGWLDPEKRPERLKPLGGSGFMTDRNERDSKVRPYHTLFLYDKENPTPRVREHLPFTTEATTARPVVNDSVNMAYNFYATRDIDRPGNYGSIIQPLVIPYVDNRPIIMPARYENRPRSHHIPKYNPFTNTDTAANELRSLIARLERERNRNALAKDQDDIVRKLRKELEDERRRLGHDSLTARRRVDEMRLEMEGRRREWEKQKLDAERAKKEKADMPKTAPLSVRPSSATVLGVMDDQRKRLIDERRKIEELLRAQKGAPNYNEVKVLKRPPPPPTPTVSDLADKRMVEDFNQLKFTEDKDTRKKFRQMYPDHPRTNKKLEAQQQALLRQQEEAIMLLAKKGVHAYPFGFSRPDWMNKPPTPFPHRLRQKDQLYAHLDIELDRLYSKAARREHALDNIERNLYTDRSDDYDRLKLSHRRPASTETLEDDTWIRPASATAL